MLKIINRLVGKNSGGNWLQSRLAYNSKPVWLTVESAVKVVYHLSPSLSESRGVINCSGNAHPASHSDLLSTQHGASTADPTVSGTPVQVENLITSAGE